jgi:hypothetical protein
MEMQDREVMCFVVEVHRSEIKTHLDRVGNVFNWTITIISGLGAGLIGFAGAGGWTNYGKSERIVIAAVIACVSIVIAFVASREMINSFKGVNENAVIVVRASECLGFFKKDSFGMTDMLYSDKWQKWGNPDYRGTPIIPYYHVSVLALLATAVTIISIAICSQLEG